MISQTPRNVPELVSSGPWRAAVLAQVRSIVEKVKASGVDYSTFVSGNSKLLDYSNYDKLLVSNNKMFVYEKKSIFTLRWTKYCWKYVTRSLKNLVMDLWNDTVGRSIATLVCGVRRRIRQAFTPKKLIIYLLVLGALAYSCEAMFNVSSRCAEGVVDCDAGFGNPNQIVPADWVAPNGHNGPPPTITLVTNVRGQVYCVELLALLRNKLAFASKKRQTYLDRARNYSLQWSKQLGVSQTQLGGFMHQTIAQSILPSVDELRSLDILERMDLHSDFERNSNGYNSSSFVGNLYSLMFRTGYGLKTFVRRLFTMKNKNFESS